MKSFWIGTAIFLAALSLGYVGLKSIPASIGYALIAEFDEVPPTDEPLVEWIKSHKGIYASFVNREKIGTRWAIKVYVGITHDGWGNPPFPKLESKCEELGYRGISGRFRPDRD